MESPRKMEKLVEKYLNGETSLAEEKALRTYFRGKDVPAHLKPYEDLFRYFIEAKEDSSTGSVSLPAEKRIFSRWAAVAAVLVAIVGIYFGQQQYKQRQAEIAYQETKKAMELLAMNLNKGREQMSYLGEFDKATSKVFIFNNSQ